MKIVIIVQARMGSTRLPGKMMMNLAGKPVIEHVFNRVVFSTLANEIWLATTTDKNDDVLAQWAQNNNIKFYRGSEHDVLDRYYQAALQAKADVVVRVTGDCPLIDPVIMDKVIEEYINGDYDYVSNIHPPTYPDGLDTEVFSFQTLKKAWQEAKLKSEREHVTPYIWNNFKFFKLKNVTADVDYSNYRWTLDTQADFDLIENIIIECERVRNQGGIFEIIEVLEKHPNWLKINSTHIRNEGYLKSVNNNI